LESQVDLTPVTGKVVLITGAAGSIGSELSRQVLYRAPPKLLLLDNNESDLYDLGEALKLTRDASHIELILCDISDAANIRQVFENYTPQVIFHTAAYKHVPLLENHPHQAIRVNIGGTSLVIQCAFETQAETFVLVSSDKAVNCSNVMGATKFLCEQIVRAFAANDSNQTMRTTIVRFGNVLGSRGSVVPLFERQIDAGGPLTVTHEQMTRYFMSIQEAVHLVIQAACLTNGHGLFVLEMGEQVRIVELAERMIRLRGLRPHKDIKIIFTGKRPGETLHEELLIPGEIRHPTSHPYIFSINTPAAPPPSFMDEIKALLDSTPQRDVPGLRQNILDMADSLRRKNSAGAKSSSA
jgi:FlaA1/EpsC-like NDP-sugar epimerase